MSSTQRPPDTIFSRLIGAAGILLCHAVTLFLAMAILVKVVPVYVLFFEDYETDLPALTVMVVGWSDFWIAYWFILFFLVMLTDAVLVLILALALQRPRMLSAYSHLWMMVALAVLVFISGALALPIYALIR